MTPQLARRPRAVLFDMDGLLLDTERLAAHAWHECARALGVTFDVALVERLVGHNFAECTRRVYAHYPADYPAEALLQSWHETYDAIVARDGVALKPGVMELLDWLDAGAVPRAVATSTRSLRARAKLAQAALLPRFHAIVGGDEVRAGKPAPDIYLEAARRLDVAPGDCVALEDSEPGVRAALAAGMPVLMIPDLLPPSAALRTAGPMVLASLHEARAHLAALPARAQISLGYNRPP